MQEEYHDFINDNELLTVPEALDAETTRAISLLTLDVKTRKLVSVSREVVEEALKCLKIVLNILAKRSNAMCDIQLTSEEKAKN